MRSILIPMDERERMDPVLRTGLLLARRFDSYVEGFALQSRISEFVTVDMGVNIPLEPFKQESLEEAKKMRALFETFMQQEGVPRQTPTAQGVSFGWLDDPMEGEGAVGSYGRVFDLIVLNRPDANSSSLHHRALESGLFESGRPLLLAPPTPPTRIATNIMIAWNGSTEQTRAVAFAMPLLQRADRVTVLTVIGGQGVPGPTGEQMARSLQRDGVAAVPLSVGLEGRSTGEAILATAKSSGSDLLIKGAYTQSRLRQLIFGGATRHILANATLPVLMAH